MTCLGYTPGGSPIFMGSTGKRKRSSSGKNPRLPCTNCDMMTPKNHAMKTGWMCPHCKEPLVIRASKMKEFVYMAKSLGIEIGDEIT